MAKNANSANNGPVMGSGGGTVITSAQPPQKPLNLLMAVSEIQQWSAIEKDTINPIDKNFLSIQQRLDFFSVGVKNAFTHFLFTLLFTPISVAVLHNLIPIFGDRQPNIFDEAYAVLLSFSMSLGFGVFLANLKDCYVGNITKGMIKNLFGGLVVGELFKDLIIAAIYGWLYITITPTNVYKALVFINNHFHPLMMRLHVNYNAVFHWILKFRETLIVSTIFVFISSVLLAGIPAAVIMYHSFKNKAEDEEL